ncbi:predicted protein [Postia placenta Mad-698-R]|nr:predicted protein [Postia placenta Mad-698-R]
MSTRLEGHTNPRSCDTLYGLVLGPLRGANTADPKTSIWMQVAYAVNICAPLDVASQSVVAYDTGQHPWSGAVRSCTYRVPSQTRYGLELQDIWMNCRPRAGTHTVPEATGERTYAPVHVDERWKCAAERSSSDSPSTPSSAEPLSRANSVLDASFAHRSSLHAPRTCRWLLEPTTYLQDDAGILSLWLGQRHILSFCGHQTRSPRKSTLQSPLQLKETRARNEQGDMPFEDLDALRPGARSLHYYAKKHREDGKSVSELCDVYQDL